MFSNKLIQTMTLSLALLINLGFASSDHGAHHDSHKESQDDHDKHDDHHNGEEEHQDAVHISKEELKEFGVELESVKSGLIENEIQLSGEVAVNEENVSHISARFAGIITQVQVKFGQYVKSGKVLAVVENSANLTSYSIKAKRSGYITFKDAALGEIVEPGQNLFRISNLNTVWVNLSVYQKDLSKIKMGMKLRIQDPYNNSEASSKISYISPVMDEQTRTVSIRATISSQRGTWKAGMFINGFLSTGSHSAKLRVPQSAVHNYEGKTVVFVKGEKGFEPKAIIKGASNEKYVEVLKGLHEGDSFVSQNGFIVKSEFGKSEMSSGHNH